MPRRDKQVMLALAVVSVAFATLHSLTGARDRRFTGAARPPAPAAQS